MTRNEFLREKALSYRSDYPQIEHLTNLALIKYRDEKFHNIKRALTDAYIFDNMPIEIDDCELIVGRLPARVERDEKTAAEYAAVKAAADDFGRPVGSTWHRVLDYEKLLAVGLNGILAEISALRAGLDYSDPDDAEKDIFYRSCEISLSGAVRFGERIRSALLAASEKAAQPRKTELLRLADIFGNIPAKPAKSFYEAVQCVWFMQVCTYAFSDTALCGRPDNYLLPYYRRDISAGLLTPDFAFEIIESLYFKHNELYGTWPGSLMLGGRTRDGRSNYNELTYMFIRAVRTTGLINPSVAVAYNKDMPDDLLAMCVDTIADGYTRPSIFNDELISDGLTDAGMEEHDARYYVHSTCVEITPVASSNVQVATPYINLNKAFEYLFTGGREIFGDRPPAVCPVQPLEEISSYDVFLSEIKKVIADIIRVELEKICRDNLWRERYTCCPFSSALINDCLTRGKDSAAGGARYNYIYPCFPGFANLADSLCAVKTAVFEKRFITLERMRELLASNFDGAERERQFLLNRCPKFGNDDPEADAAARDIYEFIRAELAKYRTSIGGTFHPSYFSWIMHGQLGRRAAATPDGRKQGAALSECMGAVQGRDKNGPSALMRSVSKIDQKYGIGGIATNFRFSKTLLASPEGRSALVDFIRTFMGMGNFEIQFNVVDQKQLLEAKKNPDEYRTLMVRVAGYSDYFTNLDPVIQDEIISRTEHGGF